MKPKAKPKPKTSDQLEKILMLLESIDAHVRMVEYREAARVGAARTPKDRKKLKARGRGGILD